MAFTFKRKCDQLIAKNKQEQSKLTPKCEARQSNAAKSGKVHPCNSKLIQAAESNAIKQASKKNQALTKKDPAATTQAISRMSSFKIQRTHFDCQYCRMSFSSYTQMEIHVEKHEKSRHQFRCNKCGSRFFELNHLRRHRCPK